MLESVMALYRQGHDQGPSCVACLEILIEMAEHYSDFFIPEAYSYLTCMCSIATETAAPAAMRHLSLEWTVTFAENAPSDARKVKGKNGTKGTSE